VVSLVRGDLLMAALVFPGAVSGFIV